MSRRVQRAQAFVRPRPFVTSVFLAILCCLLGCPQQELGALAPCTESVGRQTITQRGTNKVDFLFVVDNSRSMADEQAHLADQLPNLVKVLTSGHLDDDPKHDFPQLDLHVGVVSTDLGANIDDNFNDPSQDLCSHNHRAGDDGVLLHSGACGSLTAGAPSYLSAAPGGSIDGSTVECMVKLGIGGCGFEEQLEAPLKALTPASSDLTFARGPQTGHGDQENGGFLRRDSLIVVLLVTDEDDCSAPDLTFIRESGDKLNIACGIQGDKLYPVERYLKGLRALRPAQEDHVIFAAITGVPEDLVADPEHIDYDKILADKRMEQNAIKTKDGIVFQPACISKQLDGTPNPDGLGAVPARRIVELARSFGPQGLVQSICEKDFRGALSALLVKIRQLVIGACLARELNPDAHGLVACNVVETLPAGKQCDPDKGRTPFDATHCQVEQVPAFDGKPQAGHGFFYDQTTTEAHCPPDSGHIRFTEGDEPASGVSVDLECQEPVITHTKDPRNLDAVGVGCTPSPDDCPKRVDRDLNPQLELFCDKAQNICRQACHADADCNAPERCDLSAPQPYCVDPTCGA